jgi:hypothetical protein
VLGDEVLRRLQTVEEDVIPTDDFERPGDNA